MKKIMLFSIPIIISIIIGIQFKNKDNSIKETNVIEVPKEMFAYTIDGKGTSSMPTKDSGYIVKSITCVNGSIFTWDNTNWLIEVEKLESEDSCNIDFTKGNDTSIATVNLAYDSNVINGFDLYSYTGSVQTFNVLGTGEYTLEVWGAEGGYGYTSSSSYPAGKGGYSIGTINLNAGDTLYIYVGGSGTIGSSTSSIKTGGFNGGGNSGYNCAGSGGGATDIRINTDSLYSRVIVAGGGGGGAYYSSYSGGYGGGETGSDGTGYNTTYNSKGGSQTAGGAAGYYSSYTGTAGSFGLGGSANTTNSSYNRSGGGGGGWYGGGGGAYRSSSSSYRYGVSGGGGGSGYIYTSSTASNYPSGCLLNSNYYLTNAQTIAGNSSFPTTDGTSTETGHQGNGYAKISYSNITPPDYTTYFDSKSKTTTYGGKVTFYATSDIVSVTGCDNEIIGSRKFVVTNVTSNVTCTVKTKTL